MLFQPKVVVSHQERMEMPHQSWLALLVIHELFLWNSDTFYLLDKEGDNSWLQAEDRMR